MTVFLKFIQFFNKQIRHHGLIPEEMAISAVHLFIITAELLNSAFAVTYGCDPFYSMIQERQQTCVGSNVSYNASQDYLTVFSSFSDCENRNESESASIFFSDRNYQWTVRIDPGSEFYFEYTIMWTSPESNCVVDLTPNGPSINSDPVTSWDMVDQNGISNSPLENLTDLALNKPYTRRFILSVSAPRSYRFGFTCARPNGEILTNDQQTAIISRIMYGMTDETAHWDRAVFEPSWMGSHCTTNTSCTDPAPHEDTTCVIDGSWSDPVWYYNGSYYASTYTPSAGFNGDFYVDEIAWTDSYILGCIHPWRQNNVTIVLHPDWSMRLRFGQGKQCDMFPYTIEGRQRPNNAPLPQGFSSNCDYVLDQAKVSIDYESTTSMTFSAPLSAWTAIECTETPETLTLMPSSQNGYNTAGANAIWVLIFCLVGAALLIVGAVLGIVFGLRKRRQRQQKKDEKKPPSTSAEETETKPSERR